MATGSPSLAATLAPSFAPTSSGGKQISVVTWVFFGLFLFLAVVSRYLAKLVIALTRGLPIGEPTKIAIKRDLEYPLFLSFVVVFLYLSLIVFLPVTGLWIETPIFWIIKFFAWIVILIACVRVTRFIITAVSLFMAAANYEDYISGVIIEFLGILRVVALAFIVIILLSSFVGGTAGVSSVLAIFASINLISATLVIMFAPAFRSLFAGLTLLADKFVRTHQVIELVGATPLGRVLSVQLRNTRIRSFQDGAVLHVPNILFLTHATVNGTIRERKGGANKKKDKLLELTTVVTRANAKAGVGPPDIAGDGLGDEAKALTAFAEGLTTIRVRFPLDYSTDVKELGELVRTETAVRTVLLDDDYVLHVEQKFVPLGDVDKSKTELMLYMIKRFHEKSIKLRWLIPPS